MLKVAMVCFCLNYSLNAVDMPSDYKEPQDPRSAETAWDEAQRNLKKSDDEYQKADDDYKKAKRDFDLFANQQEADLQKLQSMEKDVAELAKIRGNASEALEAWRQREVELSKDPYVQAYKAQLERDFIPPVQTEEPSQWQTFVNSAKNWLSRGLKNLQISINEFIGNKDAANAARQDLIQLYTDLGKDGLFKRARMEQELANNLDGLSAKIAKHADALKSYQSIELDAYNYKAREDEVKGVIADLMLVQDALKDAQLDNKEKYINILRSHLEKAYTDFRINYPDQVRIALKIGALPSVTQLVNLTQAERNAQDLKPWIDAKKKDGWVGYNENEKKLLRNTIG
jgi:hypothetical protein